MLSLSRSQGRECLGQGQPGSALLSHHQAVSCRRSKNKLVAVTLPKVTVLEQLLPSPSAPGQGVGLPALRGQWQDLGNPALEPKAF